MFAAIRRWLSAKLVDPAEREAEQKVNQPVTPPTPKELPKLRPTIGVIGPSGHGKTMLTAAITRLLADPKHLRFEYDGEAYGPSIPILPVLPSEGNSTIAVRETNRKIEQTEYHFLDCPGNVPRYITQAVQAMTRMTGAIFVIAATEELTPQANLIALCVKHFGVKRLVIFINKCELASEEQVCSTEREVRTLLSEYGFPDDIRVVCGSAKEALLAESVTRTDDTCRPIWELIDNLASSIPTPEYDNDKPFLMDIEEFFTDSD